MQLYYYMNIFYCLKDISKLLKHIAYHYF